MKALTYIEHNHFALLDKPEPEIIDPRDAVVRVTLVQGRLNRIAIIGWGSIVKVLLMTVFHLVKPN